MIEKCNRPVPVWALLLAGVLIGFGCPGPGTVVSAQPDGPIWGQPFNVSDSRNASVTPAIACDAFGDVHVFWSEKVIGDVAEFPGRDVGDSIFYRRLRNGEWSPGIDIAFAGESEMSLAQPAAAADGAGMLYLIWTGYRGLYFSSAPIASATSAAAWSPLTLIVSINPMESFSGPVKRPRLIVDEAHQSLHVIYSLWGTNGNLFYLRSKDMGQTWDEPRALTEVTVATASTDVNANGRIVLDKVGGIHVIWDYLLKEGEDWRGQAIRHRASTDNGDTWSEPTDVALPWPGTVWWGTPDIVASSDKLHVVFVCGDRPRRCYTYSLDGGETWTQPERLFGDFMSLAGWDSMTLDMNEKVHLITQLRDLKSQGFIWHAALGPDGWPAEPARTPLDMAMADHFPESCISLGNELHFVMAQEQQGEVWHLVGEIYPTGVPALALPDSTNVPIVVTTTLPSPTVAVTSTLAPAEAQSSPLVGSLPAVSQVSSLSVLAIGVVPALLLVIGVILYRMRQR